jgi:hypothetical protein
MKCAITSGQFSPLQKRLAAVREYDRLQNRINQVTSDYPPIDINMVFVGRLYDKMEKLEKEYNIT